MANYKPVKTSFKPGWSGGPGRPAIPTELKLVQSIPKEVVGKIIDNFWVKTVDEIEGLLLSGQLNAMETAIAKQIKNATEGSLYAIMFLLDRRYGKPTEEKPEANQENTVGDLVAKWKDVDPKEHVALIKAAMKKEGNE
jgi:hypothetical protein